MQKPPLTFNDLMSTPIDFYTFSMNRLQISKLTKAHLVGPVYNLLKGTCKSCVELEYNMEECYRALFGELDWNNPEGNRCPYDLSKPLPLQETRASTTKTKAAKYDVEALKTWVSRHDVYSTMRILSVTSVTVDEWYGYGHLKEIVVKRADQKLYKLMEGDFPRLHLNDIKDMLLLVAQNKLNNLNGNVIVHLAVGLLMYTRSIVIQVPYTTFLEPQGVIYEDKLKRKRLLRTEELYKFSDGTLTLVRNTLDQMLKNLRLGYNKAMEMRKWTATDQKRTRIMIKDINQQLLHKRIMRSLEKFVGGRDYGTNYRLLQRTLKRKRLLRTEELYKFSDGTLTLVRNTLDQMLKNLRLGYNKAMEMRKWTTTDQKRTCIMIKDINQQLFLHRSIMRSLEKFVSKMYYASDYRLLNQTL
ncbi:hypothetical protein Tco_0821453 [Tanacetum coccineum]|uniref:Uncharacterized protein n=1 Tax=Tanacetum coccineum TaxID=301880 RepID=A0ABQ5AGN1_9ASTR